MQLINEFLTLIFQTTLVMSGIGLCFLLLRTLLAERYDTAWRRSVWLILFTGFLFLYKPHLTEGYLAESYLYVPAVPSAVRPDSVSPVLSAQLTVFVIWLLGACGMFAWLFARHSRFLSRIRRLACPETEPSVTELLALLKEEFHLKQEIRLYRVAGLSTPMLIGYLRPIILLPQQDFEPQSLHLILRHELTHYQQHDLWWKTFVELVCVLHWFNPCIYLFRHYFSIDMENACDAAVIAQEKETVRACYCQTILTVIRMQNAAETPFSTHFSTSAAAIKKRMQEVLHFRRRKPCVWLAVLLGTVTVLSASLFAFHMESEAWAFPWENETAPSFVDVYETSYFVDMAEWETETGFFTDSEWEEPATEWEEPSTE